MNSKQTTLALRVLPVWAVLAAILAAGGFLAGCEKPSRPFTGDDLSLIVSAMSEVKGYALDTEVTDNYTVFTNSWRSSDTWVWRGQTMVDVPQKAAVVSMNATDTAHPTANASRWQLYLSGGWQYYREDLPSPSPWGANPWSRVKLDDRDPLFANVSQVPSLLELLKAPASVTVAGRDRIDALDCVVLQVTPTAEAASDWVLSQDRGGSGMSWMWWHNGPERSKEIYAAGFTVGSAKFWIDQGSSRIVRVDISLQFVVKPGNAKRSDTGMEMSPGDNELDVGFDEIIVEVHGRLQFSKYGHSPRVIPPPEAFTAPTRY